ncbi:5-amino-6-(5-phosphoribosylamino)uracil reductase [Corynebacterium atrinae]|uniref:dihydrofolate reductase family protein n=1 Tax=Corynebacterium atrinae TaxID=1336740 RepID=UPI0025B38213|nr:dihydrofolate reductase family protein [Corynebacterium atrinae]WJY63566.1 5-amino-6-(5-phosphoribosylamino)uracil reductase [Corynebacterium atrinae]
MTRPYPTDLDLTELIGPIQPPRVKELRAVTVATPGGSISVDGTSGALGNETDTKLLLGLREWADVILVGARTVIAENYRPSTTPIAIITRSLSLEPGHRVLGGSPLLLTPAAALDDPRLAGRREALVAAGARFLPTGQGSPMEILAALHAEGLVRVTCEGGPGIYAMMFGADLVDVWHLTVAPVANAPVDRQLFHVPADGEGFHRRLALDYLAATDDSTVFLRYRKSVEPGGSGQVR